jgi:Uma2 family endonuclease
VAHELEGLLDDSPCLVSVTQLRLQVGKGCAYFYPDVMVMCGKNGADPADMISNPTVVVEVLSPSTELWDRMGKFALYRQVESLREYVFVSQDAVRVEWFTRRDGGWFYQEATGAEAVCRLESLDVTLSLGRIYKKWLLSQ